MLCTVPGNAGSMAKRGSGRKPHRRISRQSITASPPAITIASPLTQTGTITPFTVTSHLKMKRSNCIRAISEKTTTAIMVNGFTFSFRP